ncbi:hypothetical protein ACQ4PT_038456 [Festuca glaucescens]
MGGGPRTFPGGLSKWQHKRMHEKLARQKQRGLLRHEKQLYLARLRSEIRASHLPAAATPAAPDRGGGPTSSRAHIRALADRFLRPGAEDLWNHDDGPLRRARPPLPLPQQQPPPPARSLPSGARLVDWDQAGSGETPPRRGGAGDWKHWEELNSEEPTSGNEPRLPAVNPKRGFTQRREYGTVAAPWWWQWGSRSRSGTASQRKDASLGFFSPKRCYSGAPPCRPHRRSICALMPLGATQLAEVANGTNGTPLALFNQERLYAVAARRFGQRWGRDSSDEDEPAAKRDLRLRKFVASREEEEESEDDEQAGEASAIRRKWSSAALRNCDMKKERRVQLKTYEEENSDIAGRIQELREEIRNREVLGAERRRYESRGESLFTNKRFDEFGISPLTVKALTDAGYIQTTVVQEAALPVCLEGKDVLVKAKTGTGKSVAFLS